MKNRCTNKRNFCFEAKIILLLVLAILKILTSTDDLAQATKRSNEEIIKLIVGESQHCYACVIRSDKKLQWQCTSYQLVVAAVLLVIVSWLCVQKIVINQWCKISQQAAWLIFISRQVRVFLYSLRRYETSDSATFSQKKSKMQSLDHNAYCAQYDSINQHRIFVLYCRERV